MRLDLTEWHAPLSASGIPSTASRAAKRAASSASSGCLSIEHASRFTPKPFWVCRKLRMFCPRCLGEPFVSTRECQHIPVRALHPDPSRSEARAAGASEAQVRRASPQRPPSLGHPPHPQASSHADLAWSGASSLCKSSKLGPSSPVRCLHPNFLRRSMAAFEPGLQLTPCLTRCRLHGVGFSLFSRTLSAHRPL